MANFFPTNNVVKLFSVVLVILLAIELVNSENDETIVSFDYPYFDHTNPDDLTLEGTAKITKHGILELTNPHDSVHFVGRALYPSPVPIWDPSTGNVASFITTFSFVFENFEFYVPADGLVFFLAPHDVEPSSTATGGWLGVINGKDAFNRFVGVEFDNFHNDWDPSDSHIGIDVNSLISLKTTPWNRVNDATVSVSIAYDSNSKILSVVLTDDQGQFSTVAQVVDLKNVLPESVRIGFSASDSECCRQTHHILSWSFKSILNTKISSTISLSSINSNNTSSYVA